MECQPVAPLEKHGVLWWLGFFDLEPLDECLTLAVFHGEGGLADDSDPRHFGEGRNGVHFNKGGDWPGVGGAARHEHADGFEPVRVFGFG